MPNRFLSNIKINDAYTFPASDGTSGQVIGTDGAGNLSFINIESEAGSTVIYKDNFSGDNSTVTFTLAHVVSDEVVTQVYMDGVYQNKDTYIVSGDQITFDSAPPTGVEIEVISFNTVSTQGIIAYNGKNSTGSTIAAGTAVMAVGTDGNSGHILIAPMVADGSVEPKYFMGVTADEVINGEYVDVVHFGVIGKINTSSFSDGDVLWLDPSNNGGFTTTEPNAPSIKMAAAIVLNSSTNGKIFVRVQGNEGLHELHDVHIENLANQDILVYNTTQGYWENSKTLGDITTGNITTDGTVDGVDISAFKAAYDVHTHVEGDITDFGNYLTNITHDTVNNKLVVTTRDAATFDVDLTQYIDDSNLARLTSGSLDAATGIATFTRDDATTFTVDFSALFDDTDTNDFLTGASFNTADGVLTLNVSNQADVTVDLDGRYLESYTETDTLATVTGRGATTSSAIETGRLTIANNVSTGGFGSFDDYQIVLYKDTSATTSYGLGIESGTLMFHTNGEYKFYANNSVKATISNSGDLTLTGNISASGYNNSNWDTAYGWGDHSTAGYQSASSAITTSNIASQSVSYATNAGTLNVTANDTFSGTYSLLWHSGSDVYSSSFMTINGSTDTLNIPNINISGTLTVDGTYDGYFGHPSFSWGGSDIYPTLYSSHPDRWVMHLNPHIVWLQNGQRGFTGNTRGSQIRFEGNLASDRSWDIGCLTSIASGGDYWGVSRRISGSDTWAFYADPSANLHANSSMRAPIFYDSNNTGYYVNPAGNSQLSETYYNAWLRNNNSGSSGLYWESGSTGAGWHIYPQDATDMRFRTGGSDGGIVGTIGNETARGYIHWTTSNEIGFLNSSRSWSLRVDNSGNTFATTSHRAPVFYDSNDTSYYVNPNGVSYMNQIDGPYFRNIQIPQSGLGSSYDERVLLLIPKVETNNSYNNRVHGKFTIGKTGGNVIDYFDVEAQSVYNNTTASFTSSGQRTGHKFVTCTYNGIKWVAIKFNYTANPYNYAWFHGHAITNFSTQAQTDMLKIISYVDLSSGTTVLNSEIYNSIADYTPDPLHKTMHNGSGSSYNMHSRLNLYAPGSGWEDGLNLYASDKTNKWNLLVDNGASDMFRVAFNSSEKFRIQTNGEVYTIGTGLAGSDYRAPIFYDSDDTSWYVNPNNVSNLWDLRAYRMGITNSSSTTRYGISLYGGEASGEPTYGLLFTGTSLGSHGKITGDWATYFTMNNDSNRGWIFRRVGSGNCASISAGGHATFDGSVTTPFLDIDKTSANGPGMDLTFSGTNSTGILIRNNTGTTTSAVLFYYSSAPQGARGSITVSSTSTAYNTSSDYRLKENVVPMTGSLERVDQLKPSRFNFIGDDKTVDGFLAHEAAEVVPEAVTGTKDEVDEEGNPIYQGIDQAKLVPLLVGAIQELKAEVEALKQQLNGTN